MKKITLLIAALLSSLSFALLGLGQLALADTKSEIQSGACSASGNTDCSATTAGNNLESTISTVVNILSAIGGTAAVIMIIVGGLRYVTSAGNADAAKNAKNTIVYAVVGLIIVALAQLIVHFVLKQTTESTTTPTTSSSSSSGSGASEPNSSGARQ